MILVGNQRGGARDLAQHLMKHENERVVVHEVSGFASIDLEGAFRESYAISRATNCRQHLYSLSLNPPKEANASVADFEEAIDRAQHRLGLDGQPRAIVFHEKIGADGALRRHAHAVWCRIDGEELKAIPMSHDHRKLNDLSRDLYLEHGWTMPKGYVRSEWKDPATYSLAEWQQAKRAGRDPKDTKVMFQDCWAISDSKAAFQAALRERGLILAKGDKRGFVAVDHDGEVYALAKWTGQKTKVVKAKLGELDDLPSVQEAHKRAASIVTTRLHQLKKDQQRAAVRQRARIKKAQTCFEAQQRQERAKLSLQHHVRSMREAEERGARIRTGFWGVIDRLTGRRSRIIVENEHAKRKARSRDTAEQSTLQSRQTDEKQKFDARVADFKSGRLSTLRDLSRDKTSLTREANTKHANSEKVFKTKRRPTPTADRPKRRRSRRPRDGPGMG